MWIGWIEVELRNKKNGGGGLVLLKIVFEFRSIYWGCVCLCCNFVWRNQQEIDLTSLVTSLTVSFPKRHFCICFFNIGLSPAKLQYN